MGLQVYVVHTVKIPDQHSDNQLNEDKKWWRKSFRWSEWRTKKPIYLYKATECLEIVHNISRTK